MAHGTVLEEKDELLDAKTAKITQLWENLAKLKFSSTTKTLAIKPLVHDVSPRSQQYTELMHGSSSVPDSNASSRQGRAPPVDLYYETLKTD